MTVSRPPARAERILVAIQSLGGGGAERVVADLCAFLIGQGRDVILLTLSGDEPDAYATPAGVRRLRLDIRRPAGSRIQAVGFFLRKLLEIRRAVRVARPDAVVSFIDQTNIRLIAGLAATGIPVIAAERLHPAYNLIGGGWLLARKLLYPFASAVTVQTADGAQWFRSNTRVRRLFVIANAVRSAESFSGKPVGNAAADGGRIAAVGRLAHQKGFDLLLEAFRASGLADQGWRLCIYGEGPDREALVRQAAALGVGNAVDLPGYVPDIQRHVGEADIFVLSSRFEGFPNALLEAMQMGRACISFDCPSGPRDVIEDGRNGLLLPPEDVPGLAAALRRLAMDSTLRTSLGEQAAHVHRKFATAEIYGRWARLIDAVASGDVESLRRSLFFRDGSIGT